MSAHVLVSLLEKLGKSDKMRCLSRILSLFCKKFNKFNNTGAPISDSDYHMTLKLLRNHIFGIFYTELKWTSLRNFTKSEKQ